MKKGKRKRLWIILAAVLGVLVIFRLLLPGIVLNYANQRLANLKGYQGHVNDIDIHLLRGAYTIKGINLLKVDTTKKAKNDTTPFFRSPAVDVSLEWRSLFRGSVVGAIYVEDPVLNFVKEPIKKEKIKRDTADFKKLGDELMPITINTFKVSNGEVHYIDRSTSPPVDVMIKDIQIMAENLSTKEDSLKSLLSSRLSMRGKAYEGKFNLMLVFNPLKKQPTFDLTMEVADINLVKLNDFLKAYGNFDVKKGQLGIYAEFAAKKGEFTGYIKPLLKDLDIVQFEKEEGDVPQILWESIIGSTAEAFENQKMEQLGTKVNIEGHFENPNTDIWSAVAYLIKNAFVQALRPSVDESINLNSLNEKKKEPLLKRIFGKDKDLN